MNKFVVLSLLMLFAIPVNAQEVQGPGLSPLPLTAEQLEEQKANLIKQSVQKDAEIAKLKQSLAQTPEAVAKRIETLKNNLNKVRETEVFKACKAANGQILVSQDTRTGNLVFSGCLL